MNILRNIHLRNHSFLPLTLYDISNITVISATRYLRCGISALYSRLLSKLW